LLQIIAGPADDEGEESFDVELCTPKWISNTYTENDLIVGRHMMIVLRYDFRLIEKNIRQLVSECEGNNWNEVANKLGRIGRWEFEDYNAHVAK
jgi:hypothetical protein